jgi:hypothetical protein
MIPVRHARTVIAAFALAACGGEPDATEDLGAAASALDLPPTARGLATLHAAPTATAKSSAMVYHGGPVKLGTVRVYYVWYGDWSGRAAPKILGDLASSLGGSPYWNINTTYYDGAGRRVANAVALAGSTTDAYSQGTSLSSAGVLAVVTGAIDRGALPLDAGGVYFVLTSPDVAQGGFCSSYCGWHDHATVAGVELAYSFVGDAGRCPSACAAQAKGPNGDAGADAMASVIAHEAEEATTDPELDAWYDRRGYENADKCAWKFGTSYTAANGAKANVKLGARDYYLQQNWVNSGTGACALAY